MPNFVYCIFLKDRENDTYELLDGIYNSEELAKAQIRRYDDEPVKYDGPLYFTVERRILHTI